MQANYNLDSDDDDEEEEKELDIALAAPPKSNWHLQDIEKLREQTNALLDPKWKQARNDHLIHKLLELDQPLVTVKMVDYLMQDSVIETLVGFITQNGAGLPRPSPTDTQGESMKIAYNAVLLLSPDVISDPLNALLTKKAGVITAKMFDIFLTNSAGSFYHAYRVLESLLRCYPHETFEGLYSDNKLGERMDNLMKYAGYPPVCELLVMIIGLTPLGRGSPLFTLASKARLTFMEHLSKCNFLMLVSKVIVDPEGACICDSYVSADQHSTAAAQLLQDLIEKLSLEDVGDILLEGFGSNNGIINSYIAAMVSSTADAGVRRSAAKMICFLLRRAAEPEIVCFVPAATANAPPVTTSLPNRLYTFRENIVSFVREKFSAVTDSLLAFDDAAPSSDSVSVKYSSYEVKKPFGSLRQLIVEVVALMIESDETVASMVPLDLWKNFISWSLRYAHNNVYHALFYRLIFAVLRQGQEAPQKDIFAKAKFASYLIDNFVPYYISPEGNVMISLPLDKKSGSYDLQMRRVGARGLIMNCANAIRLQMNTQPPTSFLSSFFSNHTKWAEFLPALTVATDLQINYAMGIVISDVSTGAPITGEGMIMNESKPSLGDDSLTDLSTRFARSLGFFEDARWSLDTPSTASADDVVETLGHTTVYRHSIDDIGNLNLSYLANGEDSQGSPDGESEDVQIENSQASENT